MLKTTEKGRWAALGRQAHKNKLLLFPEIPASSDLDNLAFFGVFFGESTTPERVLPVRVGHMTIGRNSPFEVCDSDVTEAMMAFVQARNSHFGMLMRSRFTERLWRALRKNTAELRARLDSGALPGLPGLEVYLRGEMLCNMEDILA